MSAIVIEYAVLAGAFGAGVIVLGYKEHAQMMGWPVGMLLAADAGLMKGLAVASMAGAVTIAVAEMPWWSAIVVVCVGFVAGFALSQMLKSWVQMPALLGVLGGCSITAMWLF